jgi:hypothetical protein
MFSAIRGGVSLKKVEALPDVKNLSVQEEVRCVFATRRMRTSSEGGTLSDYDAVVGYRTPLQERWHELSRADDSRLQRKRTSQRRRTTASGTIESS